MKMELVNHIKEMFALAQKAVQGPALVEETGAVNAKGDRSIGMDVRVEEILINYLRQSQLPVKVFSEEQGTVELHPNPQYLVAFDPLDGSTNYKIGKNLLPYGLLLSIYEEENPQLKKVVAAGAIEYTRNLTWFYNGQSTFTADNTPVVLKRDWPVTRSTPVYLDLYYKRGYELYQSLPEQVFVRNTGSTIGNLSYVLSNAAAALGGVCMRAEEIGAVYALVKGAGGMVVDHEGQDLGERAFSPEATYPILAGAQNVVQFCLSKIQI